jgi:hypothetical protein
MSPLEDWDPDKEKDPEKIQAEMLEMGKEMVAQYKAEQEKRKQEEGAMRAGPPIAAFAYKPPTFQEVSARLKRAWEETKKIDPEAPPAVQVKMLEVLLQASWEESQAT